MKERLRNLLKSSLALIQLNNMFHGRHFTLSIICLTLSYTKGDKKVLHWTIYGEFFF